MAEEEKPKKQIPPKEQFEVDQKREANAIARADIAPDILERIGDVITPAAGPGQQPGPKPAKPSIVPEKSTDPTVSNRELRRRAAAEAAAKGPKPPRSERNYPTTRGNGTGNAQNPMDSAILRPAEKIADDAGDRAQGGNRPSAGSTTESFRVRPGVLQGANLSIDEHVGMNNIINQVSSAVGMHAQRFPMEAENLRGSLEAAHKHLLLASVHHDMGDPQSALAMMQSAASNVNQVVRVIDKANFGGKKEAIASSAWGTPVHPSDALLGHVNSYLGKYTR